MFGITNNKAGAILPVKSSKPASFFIPKMGMIPKMGKEIVNGNT
jgi:hypothetical protein